jgi:predicted unusual protein kinase regulating ubiquinone biosynthesis (AarF/ABC1/UbiB family)
MSGREPTDRPVQDKPIPVSRVRRSAMLGGLAAEQATRYAGTRAANLARAPAARRVALDERHVQAAEQILAVLGTMKGPAMKLGQMMSFLDLGLLPRRVRPGFQATLATLCAAAPELPWARLEPVLTANLGRPVAQAFAEFDTTPIAAASIGQVYRAQTRDGRDVAVKVQYPRIVAAARADLKNLAMLLRLGKRFAPNLDMEALGSELTARMTDELDYAREAAHQRRLAALYDGHPFVVVPKTVDELCTSQVLVTEYVAGADFGEICTRDQDVRDRVGEIAYRFYLGTPLSARHFSGDPHPGNLLLCDDGRVAFVDFGLCVQLRSTVAESLLAGLRAAAEGRGDDVVALLTAEHVLDRNAAVAPQAVLEYLAGVAGWLITDESIQVTPRMATVAIARSVLPSGKHAEFLRAQRLPPEHMLFLRTVVATLGLLGQLGARANWHRIGREWVYDDVPATPLGEAAGEFARHSRRAP